MKIVRTFMLILGIIAFAIGLIWMGQGSGYFPYPRSSFMIDQSPWILRGAIVAAAGLVVALLARRR